MELKDKIIEDKQKYWDTCADLYDKRIQDHFFEHHPKKKIKKQNTYSSYSFIRGFIKTIRNIKRVISLFFLLKKTTTCNSGIHSILNW